MVYKLWGRSGQSMPGAGGTVVVVREERGEHRWGAGSFLVLHRPQEYNTKEFNPCAFITKRLYLDIT